MNPNLTLRPKTGSVYNRRFALKWPQLVAALVNWDGIPSKRRFPIESKATEISGNGEESAEGAQQSEESAGSGEESAEGAQQSEESAGSGVDTFLGGDDVWIESELQVTIRVESLGSRV